MPQETGDLQTWHSGLHDFWSSRLWRWLNQIARRLARTYESERVTAVTQDHRTNSNSKNSILKYTLNIPCITLTEAIRGSLIYKTFALSLVTARSARGLTHSDTTQFPKAYKPEPVLYIFPSLSGFHNTASSCEEVSGQWPRSSVNSFLRHANHIKHDCRALFQYWCI